MRTHLPHAIVVMALTSGWASPAAAQQIRTDVAGNTLPSAASKPQLIRDLLHDQKRIWTFPIEVARGRHSKGVLILAATTAGLAAIDPYDAPYFRRTQQFAGFNRSFSGLNTGLGEGLFPGALYLAGLFRGDAYAERTAILAGEALIDSEIVSEVVQNGTRRLRPSDISPSGNFADTWFDVRGGVLVARGSFPSGHATGAFALAAIVAERYQRHRWVPWVAYGLAGTVGFSRVALQAHFPSDVFAGAIVACLIGHHVVLRRDR